LELFSLEEKAAPVAGAAFSFLLARISTGRLLIAALSLIFSLSVEVRFVCGDKIAMSTRCRI
jgi:hypothetical protein